MTPPNEPPAPRISLRRISASAAAVAVDLARELVDVPTQPVTLERRSRAVGSLRSVRSGAPGSGRYPEVAGVPPPCKHVLTTPRASGVALASPRASFAKTDEEAGERGDDFDPNDTPSVRRRRASHPPDGKRYCEDGVRRSGGTLSATAHVITAVVGAGVLSLPAAMANLGYAGGTACFLIFGLVTAYTAALLADCYSIRVAGKDVRQRTYSQMVATTLGVRAERLVAVIQLVNLVLTSIPYQIVAAKTMETLAREAGHAGPFSRYTPNVLLFGGVQLLFSQVPSLDYLEWASLIGAVASFGYSAAALGLSCYFLKGSPLLGSAFGGGDAWAKLAALGNVMFAFSFAYILLEVQDTVHGDGTPRGPIKPMKMAANSAVSIITAFYVAVAVAGYGVFGDGTGNQFGTGIKDDILGSFPPGGAARAVVIAANAMVLLHLVPAYAVWSQPFFAYFEQRADAAEDASGKRPCCGASPLVFRLILRTTFVVLGTLLACAIPSLGVILGLAGALAFWPGARVERGEGGVERGAADARRAHGPTPSSPHPSSATVLFPIWCWIRVFQPRPGVRRSLVGLSILCAVVTAATAVSGVQQIVSQASEFKIFQE